MSSAQVRGTEDFIRLSKALKAAGRSELRKELNKGLRRAAKPLIAQTRAAALEKLPKAGGLNELVAKTPQRVQVRTGAKTAGVRIVVVQSRSGARRANRGVLRHPVFADTTKPRDEWTWVDQKVNSDWFDGPLREGAPLVVPQLTVAMQAIADRVVRGVRK